MTIEWSKTNNGDEKIDGRYQRFKTCIGKGSFKHVYEAFDKKTQKDVAWNVLDLERVSSDIELERIRKETVILKSLKHRNILKFHDTWLTPQGDKLVFITDIMRDGSLLQYIMNRDITLGRVKEFSRQILSALRYLHEGVGSPPRPVIHRDLKCDNIFIDASMNRIVLGDWGLSTRLFSTKQSKGKSVVGTPQFMAPEMFEEDYNEKVDIYAFGLCMVQMVTKKYPYQECRTLHQVYKKVTEKESPAVLKSVISKSVRDFIRLCCDFDPSQRPAACMLLRHPFLNFDYPIDNLSCSHKLIVTRDWALPGSEVENKSPHHESDRFLMGVQQMNGGLAKIDEQPPNDAPAIDLDGRPEWKPLKDTPMPHPAETPSRPTAITPNQEKWASKPKQQLAAHDIKAGSSKTELATRRSEVKAQENDGAGLHLQGQPVATELSSTPSQGNGTWASPHDKQFTPHQYQAGSSKAEQMTRKAEIINIEKKAGADPRIYLRVVAASNSEASGVTGDIIKIISFEYKQGDTPYSIAMEMVSDCGLKHEMLAEIEEALSEENRSKKLPSGYVTNKNGHVSFNEQHTSDQSKPLLAVDMVPVSSCVVLPASPQIDNSSYVKIDEKAPEASLPSEHSHKHVAHPEPKRNFPSSQHGYQGSLPHSQRSHSKTPSGSQREPTYIQPELQQGSRNMRAVDSQAYLSPKHLYPVLEDGNRLAKLADNHADVNTIDKPKQNGGMHEPRMNHIKVKPQTSRTFSEERDEDGNERLTEPAPISEGNTAPIELPRNISPDSSSAPKLAQLKRQSSGKSSTAESKRERIKQQMIEEQKKLENDNLVGRDAKRRTKPDRCSLAKTLTKAPLNNPLVNSNIAPGQPSIRTETRPKVAEKPDVMTEGKSNTIAAPSGRTGQESRNGTFNDSSTAGLDILANTVGKKMEEGPNGNVPGNIRHPIEEEEKANHNNPVSKKRKIIQKDGLRSRPGLNLASNDSLGLKSTEFLDRPVGLESNPKIGCKSRTSIKEINLLADHTDNTVRTSGDKNGTSKLTAEAEHKDFLARAKKHLDIINQKLTDNRKKVMNEYRQRLEEIDEYMDMCYNSDLRKKTTDPKKQESLDEILRDFKNQFKRMRRQSKVFEGHRGLEMPKSSG